MISQHTVQGGDAQPVLRVENLVTEFRDELRGRVQVVRDVSFDVYEGQTLGLVGESGSGKSVTALSVLGLVQYGGGRVVSGTAWFEGMDLIALPKKRLQLVRGGRIGMIFQDPMTSLNPVLTIGRQLTETTRRHLGLSRADAQRRALEVLDMVRMPDARSKLSAYPYQLSGGMRQRVMIAMALSCKPSLVIADEPTTALDVTVQAQILDLVTELAKESRTAVILISHDLGVIAGIADRVAVMYSGQIIETGTVQRVLRNPRHPYTLGLLRSSPRVDQPRTQTLMAIPGSAPEPSFERVGCAFRPRCPFAHEICMQTAPEMRPVAGIGNVAIQEVACWAELSDASVFERALIPGTGAP